MANSGCMIPPEHNRSSFNVSSSNLNCSTDVAEAGEYGEFYDVAQFVTGIVFYPITIAIGLTGNFLILIVLSHKKMTLTALNVYLTALAVSDIIKLLNDVLYVLVSILLRRHPLAGNRMMGYMYPFSHYIFNQSVCVSAWMTVAVGLERYASVCHNRWGNIFYSVYKARVISALIFVAMSLVAVPSAFRYTSVIQLDSGDYYSKGREL